MNFTKFSAVISILLGVAAILLPYFFGTLAVMMLGGVMLASGIVSLFYVNTARREGIPVSVAYRQSKGPFHTSPTTPGCC